MASPTEHKLAAVADHRRQAALRPYNTGIGPCDSSNFPPSLTPEPGRLSRACAARALGEGLMSSGVRPLSLHRLQREPRGCQLVWWHCCGYPDDNHAAIPQGIADVHHFLHEPNSENSFGAVGSAPSKTGAWKAASSLCSVAAARLEEQLRMKRSGGGASDG
jgi:hypothetical protein